MISFFKSAGFKTFWLSNQYRTGRSEDLIGENALQTDTYHFVNNANADTLLFDSLSFDEKLVDPYEKALEDPALKKVVFVHLLGSHTPYNRRYPPETEEKINKNALLATDKSTFEYETSLAYTDSVLNTLFMLLRKKQIVSYFMYFSDHGSDPTAPLKRGVYDVKELLEVPFIVWVSQKYKSLQPNKTLSIANNKDKSYQMNRLIHSILDLSGLSHTYIHEEDSLFSDELKLKQIQSIIDVQ